jgi:hypothetical protein
MAARHFFVDTMLAFGEQRQGLALEALLRGVDFDLRQEARDLKPLTQPAVGCWKGLAPRLPKCTRTHLVR